ncbi:MAG: TetR/AcrR family transcriptional regulator [Bacteroidales bacterium]|nr:TetR/AcrR family transcriptional regulator [Bacteroidales bacterium]
MTKRQIEIIRKSINIIAHKGIQGLTMKKLAEEIGISEAAIYRHFKSKTDILLAILKNFENMSVFMEESLVSINEDPFKKIGLLFTNIIEIFSKEPSHISVIFSEEIFKSEAVLRKKIRKIMEQKEQAVENIILEGQNKGEIRNDLDNKNSALIVMGTFRYMIKQMDLKGKHENLLEEQEKLVKDLKILFKPV